MTKVMPKGSNTPLGGVAAVRAVLRWRIVAGAPDVDVSALLLAADGRVRSDEDFVFYNQPRHPTGLVRHRSKTRLGDEVTDTVDIDLDRLPPDVQRVVVGGSVERGTFGEIPGLHILLYDIAGGPGAEALARFDIVDANGVTALLCGELYRRGGGWKFRAIGQGYSAGLVGLATDFGITVEEEEEEQGGGGQQSRAVEVPAEAGAEVAAAAVAAAAAAAAGGAAKPAPAPAPAAVPATSPPPVPSTPPATRPAPSTPPVPAAQPVAAAQVSPESRPEPAPEQPAAAVYPPPRPALLPEPEGFVLPLQGPQFQPTGR